MIQDIVDYTAIALMWIIVVLGNLVIKKVQPEIAKPYFFYTLLIAVGTLIDSLNKIGVDSSFKFRKKIAAANGIEDYAGTAEQNLLMLRLLNEGKLVKV